MKKYVFLIIVSILISFKISYASKLDFNTGISNNSNLTNAQINSTKENNKSDDFTKYPELFITILAIIGIYIMYKLNSMQEMINKCFENLKSNLINIKNEIPNKRIIDEAFNALQTEGEVYIAIKGFTGQAIDLMKMRRDFVKKAKLIIAIIIGCSIILLVLPCIKPALKLIFKSIFEYTFMTKIISYTEIIDKIIHAIPLLLLIYILWRVMKFLLNTLDISNWEKWNYAIDMWKKIKFAKDNNDDKAFKELIDEWNRDKNNKFFGNKNQDQKIIK